MKIKTAELAGNALAWAVGMAEGYELSLYGVDPSIRAKVPGLGIHAPWKPHYYWNQGGPIIEREKLVIAYEYATERWQSYLQSEGAMYYGPTPLIAAMRCYCVSKLGDEVEIPPELQ